VGHQIYVVDAARGEARGSRRCIAEDASPRFSPGRPPRLYVDRGHLGDTSLLTEIDLRLRRAEDDRGLAGPQLRPAYSPDGARSPFASNITGEYAVYRQRLADGRSWRVTHERGDARYPDYRPDR
jgi:Tol biopolymer transport system component